MIKKLLTISTLISIFLMVGCEKNRQHAEKLQEIINTLQISVKDNLKVCVEDSCDSKIRFYINELELSSYVSTVDPENRFIFKIVNPENNNNEDKYIGVSLENWQEFVNSIYDLDDIQKEQELRKFFQENFDTFDYLKHIETTVFNEETKTNVTTHTFQYHNGTEYVPFSEDGDQFKDLESMGAKLEAEKFDSLAETLELTYGLSSKKRAKQVFSGPSRS